jgi:hypothetical protein
MKDERRKTSEGARRERENFHFIKRNGEIEFAALLLSQRMKYSLKPHIRLIWDSFCIPQQPPLPVSCLRCVRILDLDSLFLKQMKSYE